MKKLLLACSFGLFLCSNLLFAQNFYFGNDLSYVNEMDDCGVIYKENGAAKDPYQIFADHHGNLVRLRLWHTPAWYDTLNAGNRYSDFADVRRSILRAKAANMQVLLDFHLSDTWADPAHQVVPKAWEGVVNNLPVLKDSLYNYVRKTLLDLDAEGLLPEMVQIGNETNKGIMLAPQVDAAGWSLDWSRNSQLFKTGIQAVRDVETVTGKKVKVALHIAGPSNASWLMQGFWSNGVKDFDVIGLSYYWAWHKPTTIAETGNIIAQLRQLYAGKEVMIFETGYIWTFANNDNANNIINETHPSYAPASPANQKKWLVDLTKTVISKGGSGVMYWEPAWVSSPCFTPWGQGSHQEHAAFFDFQTNVLPNGGMFWMGENYGLTPAQEPSNNAKKINIATDTANRQLIVRTEGLPSPTKIILKIYASDGRLLAEQQLVTSDGSVSSMPLPMNVGSGIYFASVWAEGVLLGVEKVAF